MDAYGETGDVESLAREFRDKPLLIRTHGLYALRGACAARCQKTIDFLLGFPDLWHRLVSAIMKISPYQDSTFSSCKELMMRAVERDAKLFYYASKELRSDRDLCCAAVRKHMAVIRFAGSSMRADRAIAEMAVTCCGSTLRWFTGNLRADRELVLRAVQNDGTAIRWAHSSLRDDADLAIQAASCNATAFVYVSSRCRGDMRVVRAALHANTDPGCQAIIRRNATGEPAKLLAMLASRFRGLRPLWALAFWSLLEDIRARRKMHPEGEFMRRMIQRICSDT